MSISSKTQRGWTLVEFMVAMSLFSVGALALSTIMVFSVKSFASMTNYASLDQENRQTMDLLTKEIRQARSVKGYSTNGTSSSITIVNGDGQEVKYSFDASRQQLRRTVDGISSTMLTNCNLLNFCLFQRNPSNANFGVFPLASDNWMQSVKVVQLTWKTARTLSSGIANSENIQTARIVIRKQQDN